ncbi:uncharacterized protein BO72DRAFT_444873 [Aspergillus fijiensis CBS 313.89]|uniref:Uncharacterized protein n=1 Tax=Aspergillus fijiensis CBS 313.89 TaxID=1448319 RepID=A0A8G1RX83_9EURO|nr:uncharacterized protein BO72DRAFT_444873 [Aspergillus fijiensis CBS 313.89]RAK80874.1 hypothetical protein BO72DRAFT_444873 [Aspergillus fijiensis CBS 313.89]
MSYHSSHSQTGMTTFPFNRDVRQSSSGQHLHRCLLAAHYSTCPNPPDIHQIGYMFCEESGSQKIVGEGAGGYVSLWASGK